MTRLRTASAPLRALVATVAVLATGFTLGPVPAHAAEDDETTPLTVRLDQLSPATLPTKGSVVLAGSVTNDSAETWIAINVHPFVSAQPITSRDELAAAAQSDPASEVGTRLVDPGQFAAIGDLEPGDSATFRISLPVADLPITRTAGVFWIGVHALGQNALGRDNLADGRARTFIPVVEGARRSSVALVVPIRQRVARAPGGSLLDAGGWSDLLSGQGRLRRIVDLLAEDPTARVSLLIDPAVVEAIESIAAGNPPLSLGTAPDEEPTEDPSDDPSDQASDDASNGSRSLHRTDAVDEANARSWLAEFAASAATRPVLGLGYADPDTAALARRSPTLLDRSAALSSETFERLELDATPAVASPDGWLDDEAFAEIAPGTLVLVSDHSAPRTRTQWRTAAGQDLVFTDAQASAGGPGPTPELDALALRQRILADAALRAQAGTGTPLVVALPPGWNPGENWRSAEFFDGLDQPWLDLVGLGNSGPATPTFDAILGYPASVRGQEIGVANVTVARDLVATGTVLEQLLRTDNTAGHDVAGIALNAVSYQARRDPGRAAAQVSSTDAALHRRLGAVEVIGTDFVTLSGGSGTVAVTLVNRLEQPIEVGIATSSGVGVRIETPDAQTLAPGQRTVLRLRATASRIGVHEVTLTPVTSTGLAVGTPLTFSMRTSEVGTLIWFVLIGAGGLLIVMIGRRVLRGLRDHRWRA